MRSNLNGTLTPNANRPTDRKVVLHVVTRDGSLPREPGGPCPFADLYARQGRLRPWCEAQDRRYTLQCYKALRPRAQVLYLRRLDRKSKSAAAARQRPVELDSWLSETGLGFPPGELASADERFVITERGQGVMAALDAELAWEQGELDDGHLLS